MPAGPIRSAPERSSWVMVRAVNQDGKWARMTLTGTWLAGGEAAQVGHDRLPGQGCDADRQTLAGAGRPRPERGGYRGSGWFGLAGRAGVVDAVVA